MAASKKRVSAKRKKEFSKMMCLTGFILFFIIGVYMILRYFSLVKLAIVSGAMVMPDSALPIAGITFILAPIISYLAYQFGLKNSRNKYGVDENGEPFKREIE